MSGLNKVMVIGYLGSDPEMRYTASGAAVTTFRIAVNRVWVDPAGDRRDETEWFTVVAWNKLAEVCGQHLTKGRKVFVEGRLATRSWEGRNGQKQYRTEVIATTVLFLDKLDKGTPVGATTASARRYEDEEDFDVEDIPFD